MKRMAVLGLLGLAVGVGVWHVATAYQASVRYGTWDPCEMIGIRLADEAVTVTDIALGHSSHQARDELQTFFVKQARKDGANACWSSVLYGKPTETEQAERRHRLADSIADAWNEGGSERAWAVSTARENREWAENFLWGHPVWGEVNRGH